MKLLECQQKRILELYNICYGVPCEAERILNEYPANRITDMMLEKRWATADKQPKKRMEVINQLVREAYKTCNRSLEAMEKYVLEKTTIEICGREIKRIYIGNETVQRAAIGLGLKLIINPRGKPAGDNGRRAYKILHPKKQKLSEEEKAKRRWLPPPEIVAG